VVGGGFAGLEELDHLCAGAGQRGVRPMVQKASTGAFESYD
jgi:hypothetical protein